MSALEVAGLTVSYGDAAPVLRDLDLAVPSGGFHALLGPSGSGKTTVLRALAGFVEPTAGTVRLGGRDLLGVDPARRGVGVVFQSYALFPHLDVAGNVAFGLRAQRVPRDERRQRVADVLGLVRLREFAGRRPAQLSGGQQQRVALARALVIEPDLLLLDEPLSALDRKIRGDVQQELKAIQERTGVTTLLVTHDQEEALYLAERVTVLDDGVARQTGTPSHVYEQPVDAFVADFLGAANVLSGEVTVAADGAAHLVVEGLRLRLPDEPRRGPVRVAVRPERLRVVEGGPGIEAVVERVDFTGPIAVLRCRTAAGTGVTVRVWGHEAVRHRDGEAVCLAVEAGDVHVLTDRRSPA